MPKATPNQENFNAGEVSPLLYGRVKAPRYAQGLATALNYLPLLQGPITRRPGTKYVTNVKDSANPPALIPFEFSETQAYMLEFGQFYIRFFANGAPIVTSGTTYKTTGTLNANPNFYYTGTDAGVSDFPGYSSITTGTLAGGAILEVLSPYPQQYVSGIRWVQKANVLYLFHPRFPTWKLERHGQTYWSMKQVYFQDGPYLALNTYNLVGDGALVNMTPSGTTGTVLVQAGPTAVVIGVANSSGLINVTTSAAHGFNVGDRVCVKGVTGTVGAAVNYLTSGFYYWVISAVPTSASMVLAGSTFSGAYTSGGTVSPAVFVGTGGPVVGVGSGPEEVSRNFALLMTNGSNLSRFWGTIGSIVDTSAVLWCIDPVCTLPGTSAATAWQIGVWNAVNGYPSCGCFHQSRLILAGATGYPEEIDGSQTTFFEGFSLSDPTTLQPNGSTALQLPLVSTQANLLHWVKSTAQGLLAGSAAGEWNISANAIGDAITSTNVTAPQTSAFGSANVEAVQMGNATIYVQKTGRKVRELNFFFQVGTFRSTDLSELSEHITLPQVLQLAVQKQPASLTWAIRSDGALLSLTYDRDDQNLRSGWARHLLGGQSDAAGRPPQVSSIGVIPEPNATFDQLWMIVRRWINGANVYTIEYMTKINDDSVLIEDAFQGDCGATYDSPLIITAITTASPAVVTSAAHGLSNGDQIKITDVIGMNHGIVDADGNVTLVNLVNENTFIVASVTTNTFALNDFNGNPIDATANFSAYVQGGTVRKMVLTISGLTWLENETIGVLADGAIHPDVIVSNAGVVTLNYRAAKVQLGYRYNSDGQQLRLDAGSATGSSIGQTRRVSRVAVMFHRVAEFLMGMSFTRLIPVNFQRADSQQADQPTQFFSGIHRDGVESAYDFEGQFCFRQSSMLPGTILAITQMLDETDM